MTQRTKRNGLLKSGMAALSAGVVLAVTGVAMAPAGATHVDPVDTADDNPTCLDINATYVNDFKINGAPSNQVYPVSEADSGVAGGGTITIANAGATGTPSVFHFDWSSTISWDVVIVKQGDGATAYTYAPGSTGDTGLHPSLTNQQPTGGISHVTFCRDGQDPSTTTSSTSTSSTSTSSTTSTSTTSTSTTSTSTTSTSTTSTSTTSTTVAPTTTTTVPSTSTSVTVLGSTVTQTPSTTPTSAVVDPNTKTSVKGVQVTRSLARTGAESLPLTEAGVVLVMLGLAFLASGRLQATR